MALLRPDFGGNFTRGSDTAATHMRLMAKGTVYCLVVFMLTAIAVSSWLVCETVEQTEWDWLWRVFVAKHACSFDQDPACRLQFTVPTAEGPIDLTAAELAGYANTSAVQELLSGVHVKFIQAAVVGAVGGGLTAGVTLLYFVIRGRRLKRAIQLSGLSLMPAWMLYWKFTLCRQASPHIFGGRWQGIPWFSGVPMVRGSETLHSVYLGATGAGKTQLIHQRLETARQSGEHAAIYDDGGILLSKHFRIGDIILNPFDARSAYWTPFAEITCEADCRTMMGSLFPMSERTSDPIWINSARV